MCKAQLVGIKLLWEGWSVVMYSGVIGLQDAVVEGVKTALNQWKAEIGFYFYFINLELASTVIYFTLECMETALIY